MVTYFGNTRKMQIETAGFNRITSGKQTINGAWKKGSAILKTHVYWTTIHIMFGMLDA